MTPALTCESVARVGLGKPAKHEGAELLWRCPHPGPHTHGDTHPSLKINPKKDVFMCAPCGAQGKAWALAAFLAGVDAENKQAVMSWLEQHGLLNGARRITRQIVAEYNYTDEAGGLLFQVVRYAPKDFRQRCPDGQGGWIWKLDGARRVLYHLSEVLKAASVLVTEGEKDVETARKMDLVATCNVCGAGNWRDEYSEALRNKNIAIIADADEPGRNHAQAVAVSLQGKAASIKLIELPGAKDLSEWVTRGGTREALLAEIERAPQWYPEPVGTAPAANAESVILLATGVEILDWIVVFLRRFISLSVEQARVVSLWVVHTHAIDAADCTPYLSINSAEKQSGKTRLLEVLRLLVRSAWFTGRVTAAVLGRKIDAKAPTLLLDESDAAFKGDETYAEVLRGVLNSGYRRGGCSSLCVGHGASIDYKDFKTFCAKAIAGIGKLPDTVADRSIPIRLKRAQRGTVERFRERDTEQEAQGQNAQIAAWCEAHKEALRNARPDIPSDLSDRQADVCEPLLAIADAAGGEWPKAARSALIKLCVGAQAEDGSIGVRLLRDVKDVFANKKGAVEIASADLCDALALIETSPWGEWSKGKRLSPAGLARLLKPHEVYPEPLSSGQVRGYRLDRFQDAFSRYIPVEGVKVSNPQYSCGSDADFKVSNENSFRHPENAVSANNDAGSRHFDILRAGMVGIDTAGGPPESSGENLPLDETIFANPPKAAPCKASYTEGVL